MYSTPDERDEMIERYLNGKLDAPAKAAFEIAMMEDQALFERVQLLDGLKRGLATEKAALTANVGAVVLPFRAWLRQPLSAAASILVAVLGLQLVNNMVLRDDPSALPVGAFVLLEGTRGTAPTTVGGVAPYLLQIDAGLGSQTSAFTVTLRSTANNALIVEQPGLHADRDGWVRLLVTDELRGEYSLTLLWLDAAGQTQLREYTLVAGN